MENVFLTTYQLKECQVKDVKSLVTKCNKYDKTNISCPINEEDSIYFLKYIGEALASFLCLYYYGDNEYEYIAFTDPELRNRRYFSFIFRYAVNYIKKNSENIYIIFNLPHKNKTTAELLKRLGAKLDTAEIEMSLGLKSYIPSDNVRYEIILNNSLSDFEEYKIKYKGKNIGEFKLLVYKKGVYLNGFEIYEGYRAKGHGYESIKVLMSLAKKRDREYISLQVNSDNVVAVKLYEKVGFKVDNIIDVYRLKVEKNS